jgi:hypothetical protein
MYFKCSNRGQCGDSTSFTPLLPHVTQPVSGVVALKCGHPFGALCNATSTDTTVFSHLSRSFIIISDFYDRLSLNNPVITSSSWNDVIHGAMTSFVVLSVLLGGWVVAEPQGSKLDGPFHKLRSFKSRCGLPTERQLRRYQHEPGSFLPLTCFIIGFCKHRRHSTCQIQDSILE